MHPWVSPLRSLDNQISLDYPIMKNIPQSIAIHSMMVTSPVVPTIKWILLFLFYSSCLHSSSVTTPSFTQAFRMLYNSSVDTVKGGGIPPFSLLFPLSTFLGSSATTTSSFLFSLLHSCQGTLIACEVEPFDGFLTDILVLLAVFTSLVKLEI